MNSAKSLDPSLIEPVRENLLVTMNEMNGPFTALGFHLCPISQIPTYGSHKHDFYQVMFLKSGSAQLHIDFADYAVEAPAFILVAPGKVHNIVYSQDADGFSLHFASGFCPGDFNLMLKLGLFYENTNPVISFEEKLIAPFERIFLRMQNEVEVTNSYQEHYLLALLQIQLVEISRLMKLEPSLSENAGKVITKKFLLLVEKNFKQESSVNFYSKQLNISSSYLLEVIKNNLGKPAGQVIRDRIISECKELLTYSALSISEIAYQLNFNDPSYFTRFFKKYTGVTPMEFRLRR